MSSLCFCWCNGGSFDFLVLTSVEWNGMGIYSLKISCFLVRNFIYAYFSVWQFMLFICVISYLNYFTFYLSLYFKIKANLNLIFKNLTLIY